ncbi:InlB B-repeat-containing protein [Sphaerochaeta globosa]|uniref:Cell wall/surface repeat protein n=1 Tax=Sphaerochaeta globosa (strain ATCC BAA-1886 / DSM 22777 / Buddy) TaxID=158189 RepID=F0RRK3_SPHGB|nr:InlB B-repeat-containing protein [Sphaerochaeta globosa]ADY14262.1 cell wall/surface repeat protein [Sphaerochaeta globosa str. Buddy]
MKTWKILTIFTVLVLSLFIGCSDMIDTMARIELTVTINDHNIPLDSAFTLHATREGSSDQISKTLGSVATDVTLIELQSGTWTLRVQARADGVLIGEGEVSVTTKPGTAIPATINMVYQYAVTFDAASGTASLPGKDVVYADTYGTLPTASRIGYAFDGWYTGLNGTGTEVDETTTVSTTTNHTLHAKWTPLRYDITYALNSGTNNASNPSTYTIETTDIILAAPTRTGYSFGGWFADSTFAGSAVPSILQGSTGSKTLYAKWNPLSYDITYALNSGTNNASNPSTYTIEATDIILAAPTRTGYTFDGWFADSTFAGSAIPSIPQGSTGTKTLHAKWMANSNLAIFDKQEGTGGTVSVSATYDAAMPGAMAPTRAGFTFGGYYDREGGGGNQYYTDAMASMRSWDKTAETTLYAKWTSLVTYDSQGATTAADPTAKTVIYTSGIDTVGLLPTPPQRTGYTFGGWWTATSGNGTEFTAITPVNGNITVYAKWIANTYAVTYDGNGATDGSVPGTGITKTHDIDLVIHGNTGNLVRTGYAFSGWNTLSGGSGTDYAVNSTYVVNAAVTLYAKWNPHSNTAYKVEHYLQDLSGSTYTLSDTENMTGITGEPVTAEAKSYTGFTENTSNTSKVDSGTVAGDGTLVLRLYYDRNTYSVNFIENEGSAVTDLTGVRYGATITAPTAPTRTGYTFGGWYKESSLATTWTFGSDAVTSALTLYVKWTSLVTYDSQGATTAADPTAKTVIYTSGIDTVGLLPTPPQRTGYTFGGWWTATSGNGTEFTATTPVNGNITVYAKWIANTYAVTYDGNGATDGSVPGTGITKTHDIELFIHGNTGNLVRTGYAFSGWNTLSDGSGTDYAANSTYAVNAAVTLHAKWMANSNLAIFDKQEGTGGTVSVSATYDAAMPGAMAPTRAGFTFGGYYDREGGGGNQYYTDAMASMRSWDKTAETTLYAKWTSLVTYDSQGATTAADPPAKTVIYTSGIDTVGLLPTPPQRTGYTFGGWWTATSGNGTEFTATTPVNGNITVYAKWIANTYAVTYDGNGATDGFVPGTGITKTHDIDLVIHGNTGNLVRTGYAFNDWNTQADGLGTDYAVNSTYVVNAAVTLYAKWTPNTNTAFKVEHYLQDLSGSTYTLSDTENMTGITGEPVTAEAKSYTGFTENTSNTSKVDSGTVAGDGTLVLRLYYDRNTYSVNFIENEGSAVSDLTGVRYGATITAPTAPTRTGYTFGGWYKESSLTNAWSFGSDAVVADTTLYAKWITNYVVGGLGPSGGYIFYAKESYSEGWRYLEVAPSDIVLGGSDYGHVFGYYRTTPIEDNQGTGATGTAIGTGKANTASLVGSMGAAAYTESSGTTTTSDYAAKLTDDYTITNGGVTYSDWFLPSKDELNQMYLNLKVSNLVNFSSDTYNEYWTSSEYDSGYAMYQSFDNGYQGYIYRGSMGHRVRPVRAF